ncbi:MAG: nucleotidyltransferase domain-containing protein [Nitrososphaerales archaeon]
MVKTTGLGDQMRNALSKLKGIRYALLYGSFASGEETESSDIDLLLVGKVNEEEVLKVVSKVEKEVGREINYILWSDEELSNRANSKHNLLADIIRKQFIMLVRDEDEFRRAVKK